MSRSPLSPPRPSLLSLNTGAGRAALRHWRLLAWWLLLSLLPTALLALPVWRLLGESLDRSIHAPALAQALDLVALADIGHTAMRGGSLLPLAGWLALIVTLLLSPLLTGMALHAARAEQRPGFGALLAGGLGETARLARMLVVAVLPLGAAMLLAGAARGMADRYSETAVLAGSAANAALAASIVTAALLLLAHATIDAGRAILALDRRRRSAFKAWWQGCALLLRHPLRVLGAYLPITLVGLALAALFTVVRLHLPGWLQPGTAAAVAAAFVLTQAIVALLAWMRVARLFALIGVARAARLG